MKPPARAQPLRIARAWPAWLMGLPLLALASCADQTPWRQWTPRLTAPSQYQMTRESLVFHSDFPLSAHHRLVEDLIGRRADLSRQLELPLSGEPIEVYLFESSTAFESFIRLYFPSLPPRRAYFVESDSQLSVYAQWGAKVDEDLRHEMTHGYLHMVLPHLPLWLDEGLAEYYETPRGAAGYNPEHVAWLRPRVEAGTWRPDLARLERLPPTATMEEADYAEAWAWVHLLLHSRPQERQILLRYLAELRREGRADPLGPRLQQQLSEPSAALLAHLGPWLAGPSPERSG